MLRQSSGRSHRSRKLRPRQSFQALLLVAVGIWLVYQLTRSYGRRRALAAEADEDDGMDDGEPARRRLGRKGFVDFAGRASDDDVVGIVIRDERYVGGGGRSSEDDALNEAAELEGGDSDEEDQVADEDGDDHGDDADGGLATDEEEGGNDFQAENGSGDREGELTTVLGETRNGLNGSIVHQVNTTGRLHEGVAVQMVNATDAAAERTAVALHGSAPKNTSAVGHVGGVPGAENEKAYQHIVR